MQMVACPCFLKYAYMRLQATTPGSSAGLNDCGPPLDLTHSSTAAAADQGFCVSTVHDACLYVADHVKITECMYINYFEKHITSNTHESTKLTSAREA
jgi:hypothetical protein